MLVIENLGHTISPAFVAQRVQWSEALHAISVLARQVPKHLESSAPMSYSDSCLFAPPFPQPWSCPEGLFISAIPMLCWGPCHCYVLLILVQTVGVL